MRITYLMLENFIGIYAGTNKTKIEVDFKNNKNSIIILNGCNGCGKTTLLSCCHPLRGTNDSRSNFILNGTLGHKVVDLIHEGNKYHIEHFYGKKNKSFISKNGKELNENGNIKSFNDIAKKELGIDEDYFKIGRVGDNVANFIDLTTANRKKYISQFLPSIEDYLTAFSNVSDRFKSITAETKVIQKNIEKFSKLQELSDIKDSLKNLQAKKKSLEKEKAKIEKAKAKIENEREQNIKNILDIINNSEDIKKYLTECTDFFTKKYSDDFEKMAELSIQIDNMIYDYESRNSKAEGFIKIFAEKYHLAQDDDAKFDRTKKHVDKIREKNIQLKTEASKDYDASLDKIESLKKEQIEILNKLTKIEESMKEVSIDSETLEEIKSKLKTSEDEIKITKKKIKLLENKYSKDFFKTIQKEAKSLNFNSFSHMFNSMRNNILNGGSEEIIEMYLQLLESKKGYIDDYSELLEKCETLEDEIAEMTEEYNDYKSRNNVLYKNLEKRPENCVIDTCPFIEESVKFKNEEYPKMLKLKEEIKKKQKKLDELSEKLKVSLNLHNLNQEYQSFLGYFEKEIPSIIFDLKKNILHINNNNEWTEICNKILDYNNWCDLIHYIENEEASKKMFEKNIENFNLSESIRKDYQEQHDELSTKLEINKTDINEEQSNLEIHEKDFNKASRRIELCDEFNKIYDSYLESSTVYERINKEYNSLIIFYDKEKEYEQRIYDSEFDIELNCTEAELKSIDEKIIETTTSIAVIEENMKNLKDIEEDFKNVSLIKDALDPKKGIPLIFIENYLTDISHKANNLLSIAYGDDFKIRFNVSATDFNIEVYKGDGSFLEDINDASQGEKSLTSTSLSLAMLECMIEKYNVIYLDEIDATLSTANRRLFIDMLNRQIETLGLEQVFIITHNNEFYNDNVDLILFRDHDCDLNDSDFMRGKNIIADFS